MSEEKETSFFKKLKNSIVGLEKYPEMASKKWSLVISYLVKLLAIFVGVVSLCSVYKVVNEVGQVVSQIEQEIPNFTFQNNMLEIEKEEQPIIIENEENLFGMIILDSNQELSKEKIEEYKNKIKKTTNGIVFLCDKVMIKTNATTEGLIEYDYKNIAETYGIQEFTKQDFMNYFSGTNLMMLYIGVFFLTFLYMMFLYFISIWLDIILLGLFGYVTALLMRLRLRYTAMCKIAIHALTLPMLLNAIYVIVQTFTTFRIKYFEIMYIGIACIYIVAAILMIKSDVIKNGQELAKIIEEQEKVKKEMERQKEEEERQKERKEKEKKREKEREKEEKKEVGKNEPQGENA